ARDEGKGDDQVRGGAGARVHPRPHPRPAGIVPALAEEGLPRGSVRQAREDVRERSVRAADAQFRLEERLVVEIGAGLFRLGGPASRARYEREGEGTEGPEGGG